MSTKEKRVVRVPVTLDVDVVRWCEAYGVTPEQLTEHVRATVHHLLRGAGNRVDLAGATLREEPGAAPHTTMDVAIPRASLQDFWDELRGIDLFYDGQPRHRRETYRLQGMIHAYASLIGLPEMGVWRALDRGVEKAPAWPPPRFAEDVPS